MKTIKLLSLGGQFNTLFVMQTALGDAGQAGGVNFAEISRRCRVIRQIEKLAPEASEIVLEDADFDTVKQLVANYKWAGADPRLEDVLMGIVNAPASVS